MHNKIPLTLLIVIYNKSCQESATCNALSNSNQENVNIIIYDNSTADYQNKDFCNRHGWTYLGGEGNKGLSKAYNAAIDYLFENKASGYICLLDDDTHLPESFISDIKKGILQNGDKKIFVPLLIQSGKIISPVKANYKSFGNANAALSANPKELHAFNSCMTVSLEIFENYRYDERMFLDGLDHAFIRDMLKKNISPCVLPIECEHGFSGNQKGSKEGALTRYRIIVKDYKILYEDSKLKYLTIVGKRALRLCLQYKCLDFLKVFLSEQ